MPYLPIDPADVGRSYNERSMGSSGHAKACAFIEVAQAGRSGECYGVGLDANIVTASVKALVSGFNRVSARSTVGKIADVSQGIRAGSVLPGYLSGRAMLDNARITTLGRKRVGKQQQ